MSSPTSTREAPTLDVVVLIPIALEPGILGDAIPNDSVVERSETHLASGGTEKRSVIVQSGPVCGGPPGWSEGPAPFITDRRVDRGGYVSFHDDASRPERERAASGVLSESLYAAGRRWHRAADDADQLGAWLADEGQVASGVEPNVIALEVIAIDAKLTNSPAAS